MKPKLLIVSGNELKYKELSHRLSEFFECEQRDWDEPEIQGTPEEIIKHKLKSAYEKFKLPVLVDDVVVNLGVLNGFPGPYMKDFFKCFTPYEMGIKFAGSRMRTACYLGLQRDENDIIITEGSFDGVVVVPKEDNHDGRYFDIFFQADGQDKPMIEFTTEEKNKFSHRGKAMDKLIEILEAENK
jgi:non-canonical purine NTP pyrophosphatase (RdgB/HAM1 family)